jgi:glucosamine-6-phosphate deaminase
VARTAGIIADQLRQRPDSVLGLATGGTMEPVYADLVARHRAGDCSFARARSFNLDEYVGLAPAHPRSYHAYMQAQLFDHVDLPADRAHLPRGDAARPRAEAAAYEALIAAAGGIDLQLLGLGRNGHIGFNEPTSSLGSATRVKTLTQGTLDANRRFFDDAAAMPRYAITMGIATILRARRIVLLALGAEKAEAARDMIEGPVAAVCPASALQMHPATTVILDSAAAAGLRLRSYYEQVHPGGRDAEI